VFVCGMCVMLLFGVYMCDVCVLCVYSGVFVSACVVCACVLSVCGMRVYV